MDFPCFSIVFAGFLVVLAASRWISRCAARVAPVRTAQEVIGSLFEVLDANGDAARWRSRGRCPTFWPTNIKQKLCKSMKNI